MTRNGQRTLQVSRPDSTAQNTQASAPEVLSRGALDLADLLTGKVQTLQDKSIPIHARVRLTDTSLMW